jgi:hypothetical protein
MKMKRWNFDRVPVTASGYGVHAENIDEARVAACRLAQSRTWESEPYMGELAFRDNEKCSKRNKWDKGLECEICYPKGRAV